MAVLFHHLFIFLAVVVVLVSGFSKTCNSAETYGTSNTFDPVEAKDEWVLVDKCENGRLFNVTTEDETTGSLIVPILHVFGDSYQQGFAHGTLLKNQVNAFVTQAWDYIVKEVQGDIPLPRWAAHVVAEEGLEAALDLEYELTVNYTDPDFYQELHGISDASGVDYLTLRRIHMLPGLTKGHCSMFGAWGVAVPQENHLIQLRALDWDMDGPWGNYPVIIVYHPDPKMENQGHPFLTIGFVGFIGGLTGMSSVQMGISEIGVSYPDDSYGPPIGAVPLSGTPFIVLLRDILKRDQTIEDALNRMENAQRTENLILGVGDGKAGYFRGVQYGPYVFQVETPDNQDPNEDWHPRLPDRVYYGMDWFCPTYNQELGVLLENNTGLVTGLTTIKNIMGQLQSGTNHIGIYDLTSQELWVSFAGPDGAPMPNAFDRRYIHFYAQDLFDEHL
eukprot:CAMPEP_0201477678 /NCGR_PEP_ID=MMETSP0151_2-20130828/2656_1 /ASSEMBLY_ACC=CAM_ASM_000257 /TAXON_ID=200890 /ORGANISM="Paramoeba atlantica, Strain 621/1 / CCAP 1560/9" /LENGTH=445 /DNA_ID=CAMNT_0047858481 /DNA_START=36 /DNA_END=1373 /DNA_ORIENTATION=+